MRAAVGSGAFERECVYDMVSHWRGWGVFERSRREGESAGERVEIASAAIVVFM